MRRGVTLIELLITVTIVAVLSAAFMAVSRSTLEGSRAARTKSTISKIHTLLTEHWATYETRRVDVNPNYESSLEAASRGSSPRITRQELGQLNADLRLLALRELMRLEMPDRWSDVMLAPVGSTQPPQPAVLAAYPAINRLYLRRLQRLQAMGDYDVERLLENEGAECLYLTIMLATGDGEARSLFGDQDIADTDGDGAPEFVDGWGRPIHFIRWPAGFHLTNLMSYDRNSGDADAYFFDPSADHDPFDVFRRDQRGSQRAVSRRLGLPGGVVNAIVALGDQRGAYRMLPLVYSGGADGDPDLYNGRNPTDSAFQYQYAMLDPYREYQTAGLSRGAPLGFPMADNPVDGNGPVEPEVDGDNFHDNIHNHEIEAR